ncbi:hypothetical protein C0J52_26127 [Blattella germanica]|nr:hypothetical protein C0J52_26127 [Blattella germanica]
MVQRWWRWERGRHATLDVKTIKRLHANLLRTGAITHQKGAGPPKRVVTDEAKANAAAAFAPSPKKFLRQYQRECGLSYGSVQQIMKEIGLETAAALFSLYAMFI